MSEQQIDKETGTATTGHEWDGITELDNPMPRWWLTVLYATIIWSIGYMIVYPAWPLISSYTKGIFNYSSRAEVAQEVAEAKSSQRGLLEGIEKASLETIRTNSQLLEFSLAGGRAAFNVNCSQCHGTGAQGFVGYPNLNDDEWLWGGSVEEIHKTIVHGIRNDDDDEAHQSEMPAFLKDQILERDQVEQVADYVLSLSGAAYDPAHMIRGKELYVENCEACHGQSGEGNKELGAPALNNQIWLYGDDKASLIETISYSRKGAMPAWGKILDPVTVKQLAIYVHSLGGGE